VYLTISETPTICCGRYDKAIESYQQALDLRRRIHDRRGEGLTLGNLAKVYNLQRQPEKSIEYQEQALAIKREVKDRAGEGHTLNDLANAYRELGQYEKALRSYEQALEISREVKDRVVEEDALWALGTTYDSLTRYEKAVDYFQQSLTISRDLKDRPSEARALSDLMVVLGKQNEKSVAIFYGKQAVNIIQEIRANIKTLEKESQQSYLKSHEDIYRKLADLLISQGRLAEAEKVLELLKEEEFNRILHRGIRLSDPSLSYTKSEAEATNINDQLAQLASERGQLLAKVANQTATEEDRKRLDHIEFRITEANKRIKMTLAEVAKAVPEDRMMIQQSQSMMQTLRKLGEGAAALYTVVANDRGWVILTTPDFRRAYPIDTTDLNKLVSDFRLTLRSDKYDPVPLAQKLYRALFLQTSDAGTTLAADLKAYKAKTLMWSLDGVLRYVPIAALHDG
jgi:tetratricopeptide (TPR) repeat protein